MRNILLVDDHEMIRDAIKTYINENNSYEVRDEALNGAEAMDLLRNNQYDLVISDINMPIMDGLELMEKVKSEFPEQKVLVLTMFNENSKIKRMVELGANGYILKNATKTELFEALDTIMNGEDYFSKEVYDSLIQSMTKRRYKTRLTVETELSEREREVLVLIADELSNQEIADKLFISIRTVETHKRNLLEKTGCKNVAGLVMYAVEREIV